MTRLSYIESRYLDRSRIDSARRATLEELGIEADDVVGFAETFGRDTEKMFRLHELIRAGVDSLDAVDAGVIRPPIELDSGDAR